MASFYVPLPAFRAPAPLDFSGLNEGLDALGKHVEKNRLLQEQKELGEALRSGGQPTATSSSAPQYGSSQPNRLLASPASGAAAAAGRSYEPDVDSWKRSIANIETPGEADPYRALGPVVKSGDRAYGKYQVMAANVGPWTREILGRELTPEQFLASPEAQEKVFEGKFGQYVQKHGPEGAASMWFTGRPSAPDARARDANGNPIGITGREYVSRFSGGTGQPEVSPPRPQAASGGPNFSGAADVAFRQGRVDTGLSLLEAQRERENQSYARSRQERLDERQARMDAQTTEVNDITLQQKRQELETAAQRKLAGIAQTIGGQTDPAARAAMWQKFVAVNPRIASTLQQYGVDPRDAEAGSAFLIAEARGLSEPKASEYATFKPDEGIYRKGPSGVQVIREPGPAADKVPSGYRATGDGRGLEFIPGGPADPATNSRQVKYTEVQSKAANFGNMMRKAEEDLAKFAGTDEQGNPRTLENPKNFVGATRDALVPFDGLANLMTPDATQNYKQLAAQWIRAKLRKESGAAIGVDEMAQEFRTYFPQYGDGPETIKSKARARDEATKGMIAESGGAYETMFPNQPAVQQQVAPQAGPVRVETPEQYQALPAGTQYIAPDGSTRTKK